MTTEEAQESHRREAKVTGWQALRDIGVTCITYDKFYPFAICVVILGWFFLMSEGARDQLTLRILEDLGKGWIVGYVLAFVVGGGWLAHVRAITRRHRQEMDRISEEKKQLQGQLLGSLLESSVDQLPTQTKKR